MNNNSSLLTLFIPGLYYYYYFQYVLLLQFSTPPPVELEHSINSIIIVGTVAVLYDTHVRPLTLRCIFSLVRAMYSRAGSTTLQLTVTSQHSTSSNSSVNSQSRRQYYNCTLK